MNVKKTILIALKIIGIALAVLLVYNTVRNTKGDILTELKGSVKTLIALAIACYGVVNLITAWRWKILLDVQGIHIPVWTAFKLTLIGVFFSQIIPGCVSGDIIKLACIMKYAPQKGAESTLTILIDRFLGLYGLFVVAAIASLACAAIYPQTVMHNRYILLGFAFVWCSFIGMPLIWLAITLRSAFIKISFIKKMWSWCSAKMPAKVMNILTRLADGIDLYRQAQTSLLAVLGISCLVHTTLALQILLLGKAFHEHAMSFTGYLTTAQLGNATGLIPLTPGGMGIRDIVSNALLEAFGASPMEVLPLIPVGNTLILVLWALVGAIFLFQFQTKLPTNPASR